MSVTLQSLLNLPHLDWQCVLAGAITEFNATTGTLHRLDPADNLLKLVAQHGVPEHVLPMIATIPIGKGIAGAAAERLQPIELCNLQADLGGVAKEGARATNVKGSLAVPCLHNGKLRGTLGIGLMIPHDFTEAEKAKLMDMGRLIAEKL